MKKIFLFLTLTIVVFSTNSCSSDSDRTGKSDKAIGTISFKIDGVQRTYNSIHFREETYLAGTPDEYVSVEIYTDSGNYGDAIGFSFIKGDMDHIYNFTYIVGGDMGFLPKDGFLYTITSNGNDNKLIGAFSGIIEGSPDMNITEGTFNIQY